LLLLLLLLGVVGRGVVYMRAVSPSPSSSSSSSSVLEVTPRSPSSSIV